jgi:predicted nucleic acid-binding protein
MSRHLVLFDTSVLVDHLRTGRHEERLRSVTGLVRTSSVVLAELWRGATTASEATFLKTLAKNHPVLTPTEKNWIESGQLLSRMRRKKGFSPQKLRDLHFDLLIALTARSHGARLITINRTDFQLIRTYRAFDLELW